MNKKRIIALLFSICIIMTALFCFTACDEESESRWYQGEKAPSGDIGAVGDFYYEESGFNIWLKTDDGWRFVKKLDIKLSKAGDGTDNPSGGSDAGDNGGATNPGTPNGSGDSGSGEGSNSPEIVIPDKIYVGYLGYIYHGNKNTGIKADISEKYVYENTTHIASDDMREYFECSTTLKSDVVALMTHYNSVDNNTFYSGMDVSEITVSVKNATDVKIGVAKLADIKNAAENGLKVVVNGYTYSLEAGTNVIKLNYPLNVHTDETIVITGAELYYAHGLGGNDPYGDFTLLSGTASGDIYKKTGGIKDTLAISVKIIENSIYTEERVNSDLMTEANGNSVYTYSASLGGAPYAYASNTSFQKKTLTKIGIPVFSVSAIDENQTFTLYICGCNNTDKKVKETITRTITLKLPKSELGTNAASVKKWIYVDLSDLNVYVSSIETLAFGKSGDKVVWGYGPAKTSSGTSYKFIDSEDKWGSAPGSSNSIFFDIYMKSYITYNEHLEKYEERNVDNSKFDINALKKAISGKKLSILGDSISTYYEYTRGKYAKEANKTIENNECWFYTTRPSVTSVNDTWWMQAINQSGMKLHVNNSWSGDKIMPAGSRPGALARCTELHNNSGVEPDIIAVYFGSNDRYDSKVTLADFESQFNQMIDKIQDRYKNADIFVFSMQDTNIPSVTPDEVFMYNEIVERIAEEQGLGMVRISTPERFTKYNFLDYTFDGEHPNSAGMDIITDAFLEALYKKYVG